ncbi:glycine zipper domain-containing protein [Desulfocurvibacter africanus]|uniref:17 kDa surface antigen n=1 Tax=Desulfocurvibacter africanus subsp. africanus str. Walvis Bay TaxID=690850 RepID=F3YUX2_DESAF|nr:glycine zipper domain-containing protein [Desulfocurvibacter africanus]EGJ49149.1 17 kDa surface antigen [Desulfocurvibacter africanus subsp. africanus str. Walvis Bay]
MRKFATGWSFRRIVASGLLLILSSLMACSDLPGSKGQQGAVLGGAGGAVIGGATSGTTGALWGGLIGAGLGYLAGRGWEEYDKRNLYNTLENNPEGQTDTWTNPNTGNAYQATPTKTYTQGDQPCRDVRIQPADGSGEPVMARACRDENGAWRLVDG